MHTESIGQIMSGSQKFNRGQIKMNDEIDIRIAKYDIAMTPDEFRVRGLLVSDCSSLLMQHKMLVHIHTDSSAFRFEEQGRAFWLYY
jgi:hypothetical protein